MKDIGGSQTVVVMLLIAALAMAAYLSGWAYHSGQTPKWFQTSSRGNEIERVMRLLKLSKK